MTSATKPAKKPAVRKPTVAKKVTVTKKATPPARVRKVRQLGAVVKSVPVVAAKKAPRAKKTTPAKKAGAARAAAVVAAPSSAPVAQTPTRRPLVAKVRARRKVVLPFRERLEEAMHRELKHDGPVCHACRMNGSRLAALAATPKLVAV